MGVEVDLCIKHNNIVGRIEKSTILIHGLVIYHIERIGHACGLKRIMKPIRSKFEPLIVTFQTGFLFYFVATEPWESIRI